MSTNHVKMKEMFELLEHHLKEYPSNIITIRLDIQIDPSTRDIIAWQDSYATFSSDQLTWEKYSVVEYYK